MFAHQYDDYTGQQRLWPMNKNVCFCCILEAEFECFQYFSNAHTFCVASDFVNAHDYVSQWGAVGGSLDMM